jgi:hypothetical protein
VTADQLEKRRKYKAEWARRQRSAQKGATTAAKPPKVQNPVPVAKNAPAPTVKRDKPKKPKGAIAQHRAGRAEALSFLEDMLTHPNCPLSGQDFSSNRVYGLYFGIFERLTQIENIANNADQLAELRLCIAIEALRRLSGETPAGCAPALPGTR